MDNDNLQKLNDQAIDIAEELIFRGGDRATITEDFVDYLGQSDIQVADNDELEDLLENCQSAVESAIYKWTQEKKASNKIDTIISNAVEIVYGNKED